MIICITTALKSEALPIIEAFNLKPIQGHPLFPIWQNEKVKLTVSGIGKVKAAAACGYLAGIYQDEDIYGWLNVGIAGHKSLPVGTPLFAHKIVDVELKTHYFPSFACSFPCKTEECLTFSNPETNYRETGMYDMEAAGFYPIASKSAPLEMIHVFKVISDNSQTGVHSITKQKATALIASHINHIKSIIHHFQSLISEIVPFDTPFLEEFLKKWHFSTCETYQLKKLLKRWQALCPDQVLFTHELESKKNASSVIKWMEEHLSRTPFSLS